MTALYSAIGALMAMVLAFPFAYGIKKPQHFDSVDALYSRIAFTSVIGASAIFAAYEAGGRAMRRLAVAKEMIDEGQATELVLVSDAFRLWFYGATAFLLAYTFALVVFRGVVVTPLINEAREAEAERKAHSRSDS